MKNLKIFLLLLSCMLISACTSTVNFTPINPDKNKEFSATNPDEIEIFFTKKPDYKYIELGILSSLSGSVAQDEVQVYREMKEKAAEIGAHGLIVMQTLTDVMTSGSVNFDVWGNPMMSERNIIRYKYQSMAIRKTE